MFIFTIILYIFTLIFTISLCVRYYRTKSRFRKRESLIREHLSPLRKISPEETAGVRRLFGVPLPPDGEVYSLEGPVEWISVTNRNSTYKEFWIGGIQIQYRKAEMEDLFDEDDALCEFTLLPGDRRYRAYPLRINDRVISDRFGREKGFPPAPPYRGCTFRDGSSREVRALLPPLLQYGIYLCPFSLLSLTGALYSLYKEYREAPFFLTAGIIMGVLSLLPLFLPPRRREEKREICSVCGTWERIEKKGRLTRFCRLKGTEDRFRLPRKVAEQLPPAGFSGRGELYIKGGWGKRTGRLVSLGTWFLDENLGKKLIKRPFPWLILGTLLLLSGSVHFLAVAGGKNRNVLTALPRNIFQGPLVIERAEDTLNLQGGETVEFRDMLLIPDSPYSNDYLPVEDPDSLFDTLTKGQKQRVDALLEIWQYMVDNLNRTVRYRNGALLFNGKNTLVTPEDIGPYEDDLIESTDDGESFIVDLPPMICIRHESFMNFLSTPSPGGLIERIPYDHFLQRAVRSGEGLNPYIIDIVLRYKSELADRAGTIWKDSREDSTDPSEKTSPYPLFCYSDLSDYLNTVPEREKQDFQGKDLLTTPMEEIIRQNLLYGERGLFTLSGVYYLDSPYDYSRPYWYEEDSYRRIGMSPYAYYLLFLRRIILSGGFLCAGLLILASGLVSRLRD